MTPVVTPTSRVGLRPLVIRSEDGEYVVGSLDNGEFVVLPEVGRRAIELLGSGQTLAEAHRALEVEYGISVDLPDFVDQIAGIGFVEQVDGQGVPDGQVTPVPAPRLRARHVAWLISRPAAVVYLVIVLTAAFLLVTQPRSRPGSGKLLVIPWTSAILLLLTALFAIVIALHEVGHLVAARAFGLPAQVSLTTRLYFLTARTEVPCLWAVPRRQRYVVYLAGIVVDLLVLCLAVIVGTAWPSLHALLAVVAIVPIINLILQLQLYMKTDLYLVAADLTRARNLFADSTAYVRYVVGVGRERLARRPRPSLPEALSALPARERRTVRVYAGVMVAGTVFSLAFYLLVLLPAMVSVAIRGASSIRHGLAGGGIPYLLDGLLTIALQASYYALFLRTWWRRRSG